MEHTNYKICVISNLTNESMDELAEVATKNNVTFDRITNDFISLSNFKDSEFVKKVSSYDVVYYRSGLRGPILKELTEILTAKGIAFVNGFAKYPKVHEKINQALIADKYNIPQPKTIRLSTLEDGYQIVAGELGPVFVVKPDTGSKGDEVSLIRNEKEFKEFELSKKKNQYLYQEYIQDAVEYRVYTLSGKGVATYKKSPQHGDFRANLHAGGSIDKTEESMKSRLLEFGGHISRCFGADISGIDILVKGEDMLFLELNGQPGWRKLKELSGVSFADETISLLLQRAHQQKSPHTGGS